ncbi:hypothetical protein AERO8C_20532 [Aeromonas veronii]|uniref:Uncharacterized protein n=1 Tax=Aeromonas veronii TaxID=654 RepID=A0A653L2A0_AERVE|nr:hypothetical protein AERO8C_20532 [Aeromonas veronii]
MIDLLKGDFEHYFLLSLPAVSVYTPRRSKGNPEAGRAARNPTDHTPIGRGTQKRQTLLGNGFFNTG